MTTQGNLQQQQQQQSQPPQPLSINTNRTSPNSSTINFSTPVGLSENPRKSSLQSSPISLASNLNNMNLGSSTGLPQEQENNLQQPQQIYTLKIKSLPSDISLRESYAIFALAKDFLGVDLIVDSNNMPVLFAKFKSLSSASNYSQILESNQIFGPTFPAFLKTEIVDESYQTGLNIGAAAKRPSIGNQRSRFLFSDPFSNDSIPEAVPESATSTNGLGKSLLLMESQQDAREYEQLVRDPWHQQPVQQHSQSSAQLPITSNPISGQQSAQYTNSTPQTPSIEWDRRRQNSAFFNSQSPLLTSQLSSSQIPTQLSLNQQNTVPQPGQQIPQGLGQPPGMPIPPTSAPSAQSQQLPPQAQQPPSSQPQTLNNSQQSSQVDLSLLARVPPPANPADQNPPCNTLYVGNLPPDATEAELRQLFAPQRGFRRLSFRTKQQPLNGSSQPNSAGASHSHGPMCFVEFEDVAYATRALAELYGRTLPRPGGVPGKGGIRLSFSKNPLGVRGPGQRRSSSFAYQGFKG